MVVHSITLGRLVPLAALALHRVLPVGLVLGWRPMGSTRTELWIVETSRSWRLEFVLESTMLTNAFVRKTFLFDEVSWAPELP